MFRADGNTLNQQPFTLNGFGLLAKRKSKLCDVSLKHHLLFCNAQLKTKHFLFLLRRPAPPHRTGGTLLPFFFLTALFLDHILAASVAELSHPGVGDLPYGYCTSEFCRKSFASGVVGGLGCRLEMVRRMKSECEVLSFKLACIFYQSIIEYASIRQSVLHLLVAIHLLLLCLLRLGHVQVLLLYLLCPPLLLLALLPAAVPVPLFLLVLLVPRLLFLIIGCLQGRRFFLDFVFDWLLLLAVELGRQELCNLGEFILVVFLLAEHFLGFLLQFLDAQGLLPLLEHLPVVDVDKVGERIDRQGIEVLWSAPPALVVLLYLFVQESAVLLRRERVDMREKLFDLPDVVEGRFCPDRHVDVAVVGDEHVGESAVVHDVDLGPAEVEAVEAAVVEAVDVLFLEAGGVVGEEAVGQLVADQLLVAAEAHDPAQQLLVEVHDPAGPVCDLVLLPLEVVVGRPLVLGTHVHAGHLLAVVGLPVLLLVLDLRLGLHRNVVFLHWLPVIVQQDSDGK